MHRNALLICGVLFIAFVVAAPPANAQTTYTLKPTTKGTQTLSTSATPRDQKPLIICVKHLVPPRGYPPIARAARLSGTVVVKLSLSPEGSVLSAESTLGDKETTGFGILRDYSESLVKKWTFQCVGCPPGASFEHTIRFNYRLDTEDLLPDNLVIMDLPDDVTIHSRPQPCDHCPAPRTPKKGKY